MTTITNDTLFGRSFKVTLQDKEFGSVGVVRPLTFSFSVQRDSTMTPNNVNMLFHNLSEDTRAHLEQLSGGFGAGTGAAGKSKLTSNSLVPKPLPANGIPHKTTKRRVAQADQQFGVTVRLEAGYGERVGQIFFGVLRKVSSWKAGADWLTQISGGDAEHSITTAKISKTFVKGTPLTSVLRELVASLPGVGKGGLDATIHALQATGYLAGGDKLQKALTFHGDSATALEQFMRSCGMTWSIQDGAFYAGPEGVPTVPGDGPLLTSETGLIDEPQIDKNGFIVGKSLLNPDLIPGRVFRVECRRITGNFLCRKTQHKGDSSGTDWYVEWIGSPPAKGSKAAAT